MPVHREPVIIAWTGDTVTWGPAARFTPLPEPGDLTYVLVLADPEDPGLADFDAAFESTYRPCDWLWGPGTLPGARAWLQARQPPGDQAETVDRLFLLRYQGDLLYLPRKPATAASLSPGERDGTWYLLRADAPADAFSHQRQILAGVPGHAAAGGCTQCPVQTLVAGDLEQLLAQCGALGADITPRPVPDVRVAMSRMPRYNRIIGDGAWDIPPA